jgi:hypothetical protein
LGLMSAGPADVLARPHHSSSHSWTTRYDDAFFLIIQSNDMIISVCRRRRTREWIN